MHAHLVFWCPLLSSRFIPTSWEFISTERNRETVDEARTLLESGGFRVVENGTQNASLTATGFPSYLEQRQYSPAPRRWKSG